MKFVFGFCVVLALWAGPWFCPGLRLQCSHSWPSSLLSPPFTLPKFQFDSFTLHSFLPLPPFSSQHGEHVYLHGRVSRVSRSLNYTLIIILNYTLKWEAGYYRVGLGLPPPSSISLGYSLVSCSLNYTLAHRQPFASISLGHSPESCGLNYTLSFCQPSAFICVCLVEFVSFPLVMPALSCTCIDRPFVVRPTGRPGWDQRARASCPGVLVPLALAGRRSSFKFIGGTSRCVQCRPCCCLSAWLLRLLRLLLSMAGVELNPGPPPTRRSARLAAADKLQGASIAEIEAHPSIETKTDVNINTTHKQIQYKSKSTCKLINKNNSTNLDNTKNTLKTPRLPKPLGIVSNLRIGLLNIQSSRSKGAGIQDIMRDRCLDMLVLTETWMTAALMGPVSHDMTPEGYSIRNVIRDHNISKKRGGDFGYFQK